MQEKLNIILELISYCNSSCVHCIRKDASFYNYKLTYDAVIFALDTIKEFSKKHGNVELKISGGEATIWRDKEKNIQDLLFECKLRNLKFSLVTNGLIFQNYDNIEKYLGKYLKAFNELKLYITIDYFHENYEGNSSLILDNLLKYINENRYQKHVIIFVQSTFTTKRELNLTETFIHKYSKCGIRFMINPLLPWGSGKQYHNLVPHLRIGDNDKSSLGNYEKYLFLLGKKMCKWQTYKEFVSISNWNLFKKFNFCGLSLLIQNKNVYYCMGMSGKKDFLISNIQEFTYEKYIDFVKNNSYCKLWNETDVDLLYDIFKNETFSFGYGVCDMCKKLYDEKYTLV